MLKTKTFLSMVLIPLLTLSLSVHAGTLEKNRGYCQAYHSINSFLSMMSDSIEGVKLSNSVIKQIRDKMYSEKYATMPGGSSELVYSSAFKDYEKAENSARKLLMKGLDMKNYHMVSALNKGHKSKCVKLGYPIGKY